MDEKKVLMAVVLLLLSMPFADSTKPPGGTGTLSVNVDSPLNGSSLYAAENFVLTCTTTCSGSGDKSCGTVSSYAQYCTRSGCTNWTNIPSSGSLSTPDAQPQSCGSMSSGGNKICTKNWTIKATSVNTYRFNCLASSTQVKSAKDATPPQITVKQNPLKLDVRLYADSARTREFRFYDRLGSSLSNTLYYSIMVVRNDNNGVEANLSGGLYSPSGTLIQSLSEKSTDSSGLYQGSYTFNSQDTPGVWKINATASKSGPYVSANNARELHLYSGVNVSAYRMDWDSEGVLEYVLENTKLIAVFDGEGISMLYQKTGNLTYTLKDITASRGQGIVEADGGGYAISGTTLNPVGEDLPSADIVLDITLGGGAFNQIAMSACSDVVACSNRKLDVWDKYTGSMVKVFDSPLPSDVPDRESLVFGDVDNDGKKELVVGIGYRTGTIMGTMIYENDSGGEMINTYNITHCGTPTDYTVADIDRDGRNELLLFHGHWSTTHCNPTGGWLMLFESDTPGGQLSTGRTLLNAVFPEIEDLEVGNVLGSDGNPPQIVFCNSTSNYIEVWENISGGMTFKTSFLPKSGFTTDNIELEDIDGDGVREILECGPSSNATLWKYNTLTKKFEQKWNYNNSAAVEIPVCKFGKFNHDSYWDIMLTVGADVKKIMFFEGGPENYMFTNTYNSTGQQWVGMASAAVGDVNGDGYDDFAFINNSNYLMYLTNDGASWSVPWTSLSGGSGTEIVAVGDVNNHDSSGGTALRLDVGLQDSDDDYLLYTIQVVNASGSKVVESVISGALDNDVSDDKYHLEDDTDNTLASLQTDVWNNYDEFRTNYSLIYDDTVQDGGVKNNLICWMRYRSNVSFLDTGLWHQTNAEGVRIRYNISNASPGDTASYLLVFTEGNYTTVQQWASAVEEGSLPASNFMSA